jgi:hypothetical protein
MAAAPLFYADVEIVLLRLLHVACLLLEVFAFAHCVTQRKDAFQLVGQLPKGGWLAILGFAIVFTGFVGYGNLVGLMPVAAAGVYLLDTRPALRDATDGAT